MATKNNYYLAATECVSLSQQDIKNVKKNGGHKFTYARDWGGRQLSGKNNKSK